MSKVTQKDIDAHIEFVKALKALGYSDEAINSVREATLFQISSLIIRAEQTQQIYEEVFGEPLESLAGAVDSARKVRDKHKYLHTKVPLPLND